MSIRMSSPFREATVHRHHLTVPPRHPLLLGRTSINKYFVLFGFLGLLLSASLAAHGLIDRFRGS